MKNKYNIGLEIFFINLVLVAYILTSGGERIANYVISITSSVVAIIIDTCCTIKSEKKGLDILFLCLNILVLIGCITLLVIGII